MAEEHTELSEQELNKYLTVFGGSSPEDVSHAKQLWNSLWLLPPQESRLVSADVRQRLPVARGRRTSTAAPKTSEAPRRDLPGASAQQRREDRQRYAAMAARREDVLALLRKRREERIQKELVSKAWKPRKRDSRAAEDVFHEDTRDLEMDKAMVKQLH